MLKGPCLIRDSYNTKPDYKGNCIYILGRNGMLKMHTCTIQVTIQRCQMYINASTKPKELKWFTILTFVARKLHSLQKSVISCQLFKLHSFQNSVIACQVFVARFTPSIVCSAFFNFPAVFRPTLAKIYYEVFTRVFNLSTIGREH